MLAACPEPLGFVTWHLRNFIDVCLVVIFTVLLIIDFAISADIRGEYRQFCLLLSYVAVASFVFLTLRIVPLFQVIKEGTKSGSPIHALISSFIKLTYSGFTWSVVVLWVVVSYIFAVIGTIELRSNDPRHWNSVFTALCSLLRITTNSGSSSFMYTSIRGCNEYPNPDGGSVSCDNSSASPFVANMILILYQSFSRYILLNLLLAAVILEFCRQINKKGLGKNSYEQSLIKTDKDHKIEEVHEEHRHRELMALLNRIESKLDYQGKLLSQERLWAGQI